MLRSAQQNENSGLPGPCKKVRKRKIRNQWCTSRGRLSLNLQVQAAYRFRHKDHLKISHRRVVFSRSLGAVSIAADSSSGLRDAQVSMGNEPDNSTRIGAALAATGLYPKALVLVRLHPRSEEHTSELQSLRHLVCR